MITAKDVLQKNFISVQQDEQLSTVLGKLLSENESTAFVFDGTKYLGIFQPHSFIKKRLDVTEMKVGNVVTHVSILSPISTLQEMVSLFFTSYCTQLPVIGAGFVGVVKLHDILAHLTEFERSKTTTLKDIQQKEIISVTENENLDTTLELMRTKHINQVPVINANKEILGVISYIDFYKRFYLRHQKRDTGHRTGMKTKGFKANKEDSLKLPVKNMMSSKEAITTANTITIGEAAQLMSSNKVSTLLTTNEEGLTTIVTARNIIEPLIEKNKEEVQDIQFINLNNELLRDLCHSWLKKISKKYLSELTRDGQSDIHLKVHCREYNRTGTKTNYEFNIRINAAGNTLTSNNASDWDIRKSLRKGLQSLENELEHKFHWKKNVEN